MSQLFASGGQSIEASALASILPMNIQGWFPFGLTDLICAVQGTLKSLLQYHSLKASILQCSAFFMVQLSHLDMTIGKIIALTIWTFVGKVISLLFNTVYICHSFSSKEQVSFHFMTAVNICSDFEAQENKVCHCFHCFPIYLPWSSCFECWVLSQVFTLLYCLPQEAL